jgi:hypothetical protein
MKSFADSLCQRFQRNKYYYSQFEQEDHMSVMPAIIIRTLRVLYGKKKIKLENINTKIKK